MIQKSCKGDNRHHARVMIVIMWLRGSSSSTNNDKDVLYELLVVIAKMCYSVTTSLPYQGFSTTSKKRILHSLTNPAFINTDITLGSCLSSNKQKNQWPTVRRFFHQWKREVRTNLFGISRTINQEQQQCSSANCWSNFVHQLRYNLISDPASEKQRHRQSTIRRFWSRRSWWDMVRLHPSSWRLMIRCPLECRCYADSTQCSHPCTGPNFMCCYNVVRRLRYYFIPDPSLFTSSDIIISRILKQTKLIDTIQFVNYHYDLPQDATCH